METTVGKVNAVKSVSTPANDPLYWETVQVDEFGTEIIARNACVRTESE